MSLVFQCFCILDNYFCKLDPISTFFHSQRYIFSRLLGLKRVTNITKILINMAIGLSIKFGAQDFDYKCSFFYSKFFLKIGCMVHTDKYGTYISMYLFKILRIFDYKNISCGEYFKDIKRVFLLLKVTDFCKLTIYILHFFSFNYISLFLTMWYV